MRLLLVSVGRLTVVHNAAVVVGSVQIIRLLKSVFEEVVVLILGNVVPIDSDIIVTICARLFMPET